MFDDLAAARSRGVPAAVSPPYQGGVPAPEGAGEGVVEADVTEAVAKAPAKSFPLAPRCVVGPASLPTKMESPPDVLPGKNELNLPTGEKRAQVQKSAIILTISLATLALGGIIALLVEIV